MEIKIRQLNKTDLSKRVELLNNPIVSATLNTSELFTIEKTKRWFISRDLSKRLDVTFLIEDTIIGMGGLVNYSKIDKNIELYIYLSPDYHGQGLGTMCTKLLTNYGFQHFKDLNKIYLFTFANNIAANKMYEKVGYKLEGVLRQQKYHNDKLYDRYFFGLLRSEYK